ncbi:hypothetical protein [Saccharopolyspora sp. ASAGF58]|uniref:hypothetical protein n=1 Tax=Saccharopolyspora sp. ASAGF58 TaxID=2719023 RepID=UPI0014401E84|nr:hypothetical protein [Saccharopolyspora sp. ASAGF58]QIZ35313.1 hypothetical protein FDZ84_12115 [Saccharopolyspora sp. ASAGF58]
MIAWTVAVGATAVLLTLWPMYRSYFYRAQHAGSSEGAMTVRHLIARIEAESTSGGRHRLRETPAIRGESTVQPAIDEARAPTTDHESSTRRSEILSRILAGLERL